ncbi:hypothetical protein I2I11_20230 [Pontibacter sp. 172403-2]|uniref:hypothetical protein n=1 Tax=Pontibacter rufus TaxID=2791028 RepID=UPI0018AFC2AA|nr:hypothetical protein [Pontibacter sp. 172403-2]MBF9255636.1 hypothetical protein [Pontibacter sp. 172403-2]
MKQLLLITLLLFLPFSYSNAQESVVVTESTLKVAGLGEEAFYYGFAKGDEIVFDFSEANGKELKELEIIELPSSSKFSDYKVKKVQDKRIKVTKTGIYKFRLSNSSLGGRVCRLKIQRIPASENTRIFDSSVYWRTVQDTTYTTKQERYLMHADTAIVKMTDQVAPVSSTSAMNGNPNKTVVEFTLPEGTVSWSYYIGVGATGEKAYDGARDKFVNTAAASVAKLPGYGPMAALALYGINYFSKAQGEDNVKYWFIADWDNVLLFKAGKQFYQYKSGDVINEASQMKAPNRGKVYLGLLNDNVMDQIQVNVHATAITVTPVWGTRQVSQMHVQARQEPYLNALK